MKDVQAAEWDDPANTVPAAITGETAMTRTTMAHKSFAAVVADLSRMSLSKKWRQFFTKALAK
jgi:hypothetical protein